MTDYKKKRTSFKTWQASHQAKVGDVLRSSIWRHPRKVRGLDTMSVTLTEILPNGRHHNMAIVKSLPFDTHIV